MNTTHNAIIEALVKSRVLLTPPENFTIGAYARTITGIPVPAHDDGASCFCMLGAILHVIGPNCEMPACGTPDPLYGEVVQQLIIQLRTVTVNHDGPHSSIAMYSDSSSHAEVMALFDSTITRLKADVVSNDLVV